MVQPCVSKTHLDTDSLRELLLFHTQKIRRFLKEKTDNT